MVGESGGSKKQPKLFTLHFLKVIKEAQQQHGLRHGDYQRYRGYCSRRLRRIRKSLSFTQGERKGFKKKDVTSDVIVDERFLLIPLVTAERAWSCAMQLKQESNTEPRKRFHMLARFRKAEFVAKQLHALVEESGVCSPQTKLEAQAYAVWMEGSLAFELEDWQTAREQLLKAQAIYEKLGELVNEDDRDAYESKVAELKPSLRFCTYNIGETSSDNLQSSLPADLHELLLNSRVREGGKGSMTVNWCGKNIEVPDKLDKVRVFLVTLPDSERAISSSNDVKRKLELFDSLLMRCKDALSALRDDPAWKPREKEAPTSAVQHLYNYVSHIRLTKTIERNLLMIDSHQSGSSKPGDVIRLYELIMQNLTELSQIPGMEQNQDIHNQTLAYQALRCCGIAEWCRSSGKCAEALALYNRAQMHAKQATSLSKDLQSRIDQAFSTMETQSITAKAQAFLMKGQESQTSKKTSSKEKKILIHNLDAWYDEVPDMLQFPPSWRPIPCKPLFFDLAENHLEMPSLSEKLTSSQNAPSERAAAGGLSGLVRGLWGWGSRK